MCFALQDPGAWNDVASFDVSETATPPRHNQAGYTTLLQERTADTSMAFAVNTPPAVPGPDKNDASFGVASSTPIKHPQASVGRRRRRERGEPSPSRDRARSPFLEDITNSPRKTPTKLLPFTPSRVSERCLLIRYRLSRRTQVASVTWLICLVCLLAQFCNVSGAEHLNLDNPSHTSTPVCGQRCLLHTPLYKETTPKHQKENDG